MSDIAQGPDWWQASDGKWYAPEFYPSDWAPPDADSTAEEASQPVTTAPDVAPQAEAPVPAETPVEAAPIVPQDDPGPAVQAPPARPAASPIEAPVIPVFEPPADMPVPPIPTAPSVPIAESSPPPVPPPGWSTPDPAAGEPTMVAGMAAISADATTVQPAYTPPPAAAPAAWDPPAASPTGYPVAMESDAPETSADIPAGLIGLIGGAALVVGSFLAWAKAGGTLAGGTVNGLTGSNGWGTLVCGLIVAAGAGLLIAGQRKAWVGSVMGAAAVVGIGLAVFSIIDIGNTSDDLPGVLLAANIDAETANGALLDLDIGIWIVTAGGAVALLAAIIALARRN